MYYVCKRNVFDVIIQDIREVRIGDHVSFPDLS